MPRTAIAHQDLPSYYSQTGLALTFTAADVVNKNETTSAAQLLIIAKNTHGANAYAVTVTSTADNRTGRSGDATASLAAGETRIFPVSKNGWEQSGEVIHFEGANAAIEFAVVKLAA